MVSKLGTLPMRLPYLRFSPPTFPKRVEDPRNSNARERMTKTMVTLSMKDLVNYLVVVIALPGRFVASVRKQQIL